VPVGYIDSQGRVTVRDPLHNVHASHHEPGHGGTAGTLAAQGLEQSDHWHLRTSMILNTFNIRLNVQFEFESSLLAFLSEICEDA
jgi:hypothetical protein